MSSTNQPDMIVTIIDVIEEEFVFGYQASTLSVGHSTHSTMHCV